jgi:hypothetical protein
VESQAAQLNVIIDNELVAATVVIAILAGIFCGDEGERPPLQAGYKPFQLTAAGVGVTTMAFPV